MEVYVKEIEPLVNLKNNEAYTRAINLLRKVRRTLVLLGRVDEFASLVQSVRKHKPKRNFYKAARFGQMAITASASRITGAPFPTVFLMFKITSAIRLCKTPWPHYRFLSLKLAVSRFATEPDNKPLKI